jgi:hypothetical protein
VRPDLDAARQDPHIMADQMAEAWLSFVRAEAAVHPVLVVLDDLQWSDARSVALVDVALRQLTGSPILVLALARPEAPDVFPDLWAPLLQVLPLRPLGGASAARFVKQVLGEEIGEATLQRIVARAAGNALYLEELIRAADGKGELVPDTVLAMLQARIGTLAPAARRVLRAASVFGDSFPPLPNFYENGLVSHGDPWLAFGPRPGPGGFDWANGSRLYYSTIAGDAPGSATIEGNGISVSYTDDLAAAAAGDASAWSAPRIVTRENQNTLEDKESVWVDNAASSPYFGTVYVCNVAFRKHAVPVVIAVSQDGGDTWRPRQISQAAQKYVPDFRMDRQGCVIRTDSHGVVYVFWGAIQNLEVGQYLARSFDGGASFHPAKRIAPVAECGELDPVSGAFNFDGVAGTRTNSLPSVDIANGAPTGLGATDELVISWCDAGDGLDHERALVMSSTDGGETWSEPADAAAPGDRPAIPAVAIAPDGGDVYVTYDAFLAPWQPDTASPRPVQGVLRHADVLGGIVGGWSDLHRGALGDARGTSRQLNREFIYDYNQVVATPTGAVAVWTDARNAADCPAVDAYRQSLLAAPLPAPSPAFDCPAAFGNGDIYAQAVADPTP